MADYLLTYWNDAVEIFWIRWEFFCNYWHIQLIIILVVLSLTFTWCYLADKFKNRSK